MIVRHGMAWSLATWVLKGLEYIYPLFLLVLRSHAG